MVQFPASLLSLKKFQTTQLLNAALIPFSIFLWSYTVDASAKPNNKTEYKSEIETFHAKRDASLRKNWLSLTGLDWLKSGENSIGSGKDNNIHLPASVPETLGVIQLKSAKPAVVSIEFTETKSVKLDGKPVELGKFYPLQTDASAKPSLVEFNTVNFLIVERPNGLGVRTKDSANPAIAEFKEIRWWPIDEKLRITAQWVKLPEPKKIKFQDVLGNENEIEAHGYAEFKHDGHNVKLYPTEEGHSGAADAYEFVFRDRSSGKESYGAARYLNTAAPNKKGEITLDFNKAYNPPCAYTAFATCPLPPPENVLKVGIHAGELKPLTHPTHK